MKVIIATTVLIMMAIACNQPGKAPAVSPVDSISAKPDDDAQEKPKQVESIGLLKTDSGDVISFADVKDTQQANGYLPPPASGKHAYAKIWMQEGETLHAFLNPDPAGCNIRINQIISADGKMDGPFNRKLDYKAKSKGNVSLVIGHNLMAEGVDSCHFTILLSKE